MLLISDNSLSGLAATSRRAAGAASHLALVPATATAAAGNADDRRDAARRHGSSNPSDREGDLDGLPSPKRSSGFAQAGATPTSARPIAVFSPLRAVTAVDGIALSQGAWIDHEFGELIAARQAYESGVNAAKVARPTIGLVLNGEF